MAADRSGGNEGKDGASCEMEKVMPPSCTPDSTTVEFFETMERCPFDETTMPQPQERAPMKRKSDEDLRNGKEKCLKKTEENAEEERRVIIMKGNLPQLALPDGWIALNHRSGGIIYLHKTSRVCTWSRPYHIGIGSVRKSSSSSEDEFCSGCQNVSRKQQSFFELQSPGQTISIKKHDVPLAAIPCLHQKAGLVRKHKDKEEAVASKGSDSSTILSMQGASVLNVLNMSDIQPSQETLKHYISELGGEKTGVDVVLNVADTSDETNLNKETTEDCANMVNGYTDSSMLSNGSTCVAQHSQDARDVNCTQEKGHSENEMSKELEKPTREQTGSSQAPFFEVIDSKELGIYLSNLWEFQSLTHDQEKNAVVFEQPVLDGLELPASLECQPFALKSGDVAKQLLGKDLLLNAGKKTPVAILHEYCQRALKTKPVYQSSECENADTPFASEVQIDGIIYGTGKGSSKKLAKQIAAKSTLEVLLPEMFKKVLDYQISEAELEFFDKVNIVDPRLPEFCSKTTQPLPSQILEECLRRNQGICSTPIQFTTQCGPDRKLSFKITCGKHEATGPCKNKRTGKQLASQQILKKLHPHLEKWGALIRIYCDRPTGAIKKYKVDESERISEQEARRGTSQINNNLLERLKDEMRKIHLESKKEKKNDSQRSPEPVFTVDI